MNAKARQRFQQARLVLIRAATIAATLGAAVSSGDSGVVKPGALAPGHAAFAVRPAFPSIAPGGPTIVLAKVRAVLTGATGETFTSEGSFRDDVATLSFDIPINGSSAEFTLDITAFDAAGNVVYRATQRIRLRPGDNNAIPSPTLIYDAPDAKLTAIKITPGPLTITAGGVGTLSVTGTLPGGQVLSPPVGWTSTDPSIATVDANGVVHAGRSQGATTIVATTATGLTDQVAVKVHAPVDKVIVGPSTVQVIRGKTSKLTVELRDVTNKLIDDRTAVLTSSDPAIVSVSDAGLLTGLKTGKATITATSEGKTGSADVTVVSPLDRIDVTQPTLDITALRSSIPISFKLVPVAGGSVDDIVPTFTTSAPLVATVSSSGVVTSVGNGAAKVTISADGISSSVDVTVHQVAATTTISPKAASVSSLGATANFSFLAVDAGGTKLVAPVVTWTSSDPTIATVVDGVATAKRAGSVTITATVDGKSDVATFIVAPVARFLVVQSSKGQIDAGQTATLTAKFADGSGSTLGDANATFTTTTPNVASVSGNVVTGLSAGTAHIVGTAGGFTGSVDIRVIGVTAASLQVTPATVEKLPGGTQQFTVSGATAPVVWSVNGVDGGNATFGTINANGFYTAPAETPSPATFDVCATQASPSARGCSRVTISEIVSAGADVIVFNDIDTFDSDASDPNNRLMFRNLVSFTGAGSRAAQKGVMFYMGHSSRQPYALTAMRGEIAAAGYTIDDVSTDFTAPIDPKYKTVFVMLPTIAFSASEINVLKQFSGQGGRIVFIGEFQGYYTDTGIATENAFFLAMGAQMTNTGGAFDCGTVVEPASRLRPHQVTTGLTQLTVGCASEVIPGANDYPFLYDQSGQRVLAAVAKVDTRPISAVAASDVLRRARAVMLKSSSSAVASESTDTKGRPIARRP